MPSPQDIPSRGSMERLLSTAGNDLIIAEFYVNWCGNCTKIAPAYEEMAQKYGNNAQFVKVDLDKTGDIHPEYGVTSTPTFVFIKNGVAIDRFQGSNARMLEAAIQRHV
ncbi:thioredoxin-2-like isoform X2 [Paramacrobiotus metropolitanus]|uniref:thioredoxin-2-like isoform X2 n=1 Tax=Paramacrobiotus metropolitanus TaxID=2943436 RepID=UPI002446173E|nr:thioredoxin-2-like isoform X2 [Paramacrobiotus metropolitanus]